MTYQTSTQQRYAELLAEARIEKDAAGAALRDLQRDAGVKNAEMQRVRAQKKHASIHAHRALDHLAVNAETLVAQNADNWLYSLILPDPSSPPSSLGAAWLLRDPAYIAAMHERIDQIAENPQDSGLHSRSLESIDAEVETLRAQLEEINADKCEAEERLKEAVHNFQEYEFGRVRI